MAVKPVGHFKLLLPFLLATLALPSSLAQAAKARDWNESLDSAFRAIAEQNYRRAEGILRRTVELAKRSEGYLSGATALSLEHLGFVLFKQEFYSEALPILEESLAIQEKVGYKKNLQAATLNYLGLTNKYLGRPMTGVRQLKLALKIRKETGAGDQAIGQTLNNLGQVYSNAGKHHSAIKYYKRALKLHLKKKPPNFNELSSVHNAIGGVYRELGDTDGALRHYTRAAMMADKSGKDTLRLSSALHNLSQLYFMTGEPARGEVLCDETIRIKESHLGPNHRSIARTLEVCAIMLRDHGRTDKGAGFARRAEQIQRTVASPQPQRKRSK